MVINYLNDLLHDESKFVDKIFYISLQRCGTKSFGEFFKRNGFSVASWTEALKNRWVENAVDGRFDEILKSNDFKNNFIFEDSPWSYVPLIKHIYHTYPGSRFVYFSRPVDDWFNSMLSHSGGMNPGKTKTHCIVYGRLDEYYSMIEKGEEIKQTNGLSLVNEFERYKDFFNNHYLQLKAFFEDKDHKRFYFGDLYDKNRLIKLNEHFNLNLKNTDDVHIHKTGRPVHEDQLKQNKDSF